MCVCVCVCPGYAMASSKNSLPCSIVVIKLFLIHALVIDHFMYNFSKSLPFLPQLVIDQVPSLDLKRTFLFTLLGLVLVGPTLHIW